VSDESETDEMFQVGEVGEMGVVGVLVHNAGGQVSDVSEEVKMSKECAHYGKV
jgi:hypothetical protein